MRCGHCLCLLFSYNCYRVACLTRRSLVELLQGGASGLSVLRTFRLLRILKVVRFLPALRYQLLVMLRTMDNVATFFALLILFIFIFRFLPPACHLLHWRRHGVDWGRHVHPTFARGRSWNWYKSDEFLHGKGEDGRSATPLNSCDSRFTVELTRSPAIPQTDRATLYVTILSTVETSCTTNPQTNQSNGVSGLRVTQCGIGGRKPSCHNPARFVQSFRYNTGLWRQTDWHTTTPCTALA